MKINIAGGGPAGLYLAQLAKKLDPQHEITVHERDPAVNTYGWSPIDTEETARYASSLINAEELA